MKLPFFQMYPSDYLRDTRVLSLAAKGGWFDVLCMLHSSSTRGTMTLPLVGWARIMAASVDQAEAVVSELDGMKVADVQRHSNGDVTLSSRRMLREHITREQTRLRVSKHRARDPCNGIGNAVETPQKAETKKLETKKRSTIPAVGGVTAEQIYEVYPRKIAKQDALKAISKALLHVDPGKLLAATEGYASAVEKWREDERKFIPHPATWYNGGRYEDDPATWERKEDRDKREAGFAH